MSEAHHQQTLSEVAKVQHNNRAHARLSASSSHRWMMCPPSVMLSEQFVETPSQYAEEGTYLHELCEIKLRRCLKDIPDEVFQRLYTEHRDNDFYSDEAEVVTDEYVSFCMETIEAVRASCADPLILIEHRLDYSEYVPGGFGTGDLIIVADGVMEIIDFKGGRGVRVEAEKNSQLMLYALGALLEFDTLYDVSAIRMTIVQPRLNNVSTYEATPEELLRWAKEEVQPRALLADRGEGEFCAGEHCRFCRARYTCRARSEYHMRLAKQDFKAPDLLTDAEIVDILPMAESLNNWVQDLIAYATQQAIDGKTWTGYKLVAGRTQRKFSSEAEVIQAATLAGYADIYKTALLGIGEMEKRMGRKAFQDVLGKFVVKPAGAPTLVPESDPRKPISTAEADFAE